MYRLHKGTSKIGTMPGFIPYLIKFARRGSIKQTRKKSDASQNPGGRTDIGRSASLPRWSPALRWGAGGPLRGDGAEVAEQLQPAAVPQHGGAGLPGGPGGTHSFGSSHPSHPHRRGLNSGGHVNHLESYSRKHHPEVLRQAHCNLMSISCCSRVQ